MDEFSFRTLYGHIVRYGLDVLEREVLLSSKADAKAVVTKLARYKKRNQDGNIYDVEDDDLWNLYALSRVNDVLLRTFQSEDVKINREGALRHYLEFFWDLGLEPFSQQAFHPFFHEIVHVIEDPACEQHEVRIERVFWPGLMFGDMLFSREGVKLRCNPETMRKDIAERSRLYFTFLRLNRQTHDLSQGWGHNSQWRNRFRRDYRDEGMFHYNVDGEYILDENYASHRDQVEGSGWNVGQATLEERRELLRHRCFVRTLKSDDDLWPYCDSWSEPCRATP